MADRIVENYTGEVPAMPEVLQRLIIEALNEGKRHLEEHGVVVPFTMLVVGNSLFTEAAEGNSPKECYNVGRHTVEGARGASAYAFCYDGYLDTDEGTKDAIIAEGGVPGGETAFALGYLYEPASTPDEKPKFSTNPSYIGPAPNFMADLTDASEYSDVDDDADADVDA